MKLILPYVTTPEEKVVKMVAFADVRQGMRSVDLGAGDGRVVIAMAKAGALAYGFENVRKYARRAKTNITRAGLQEKAFVTEANFWQEDLSSFHIVTFYAMADYMVPLGKKLTQELRPGTIVISNGFMIPEWRIEKEDDHLYFYKKA